MNVCEIVRERKKKCSTEKRKDGNNNQRKGDGK